MTTETDSSTVLLDLYNQLKQFSHLQQLHSVLSADVRSCRERVLKETKSVRRELTFYRWCQRRNLKEAYPFPRASDGTKGLDYDRLVFYRKLICYLHCHPLEFGAIIVSLPEIKNAPSSSSLEYLYFDRERDLAECIAFDIMMTDINSLTLLLRCILLNSSKGKNIFNTLSQKLFQLFIIITCHKLINTTFRSLLNRLYRISDKLSFCALRGSRDDMMSSTLYKACDDVLNVMTCFLRILPHPLRHCISIMREKGMILSVSSLLEWLLSRIFSPLLLAPDDWYLVICNPAKDEDTNNNNIQSIVTTLLRMCRAYANDKPNATDDSCDDVELTQLLLDSHSATLTLLLNKILSNVMPRDDIIPSAVLVPSNATPELFVWHQILLKMVDSECISSELRSLVTSTEPPSSIAFRPWITIQLPQLSADATNGTPESQHLSRHIFEPIRVFLLSLSSAQCLSIASNVDILTTTHELIEFELNLNTQQMTLLHESRARCGAIANLDGVLCAIVREYDRSFCAELFAALSTHNVLSSLNYIRQTASTLVELRQIFIESHQNLQMRDILRLSKRVENVSILRLQIEKIMYSLSQQSVTSAEDGSDWLSDKFVFFRTTKCISKTRNALIRFLNDYGIGCVDFKCKFGGAVLDFTNKRISRILVNAIIFEIRDIFWNRCPHEDAKFKFEIQLLNDKFGANLVSFLDAFLSSNERSKVRISAQTLAMMIKQMRRINHINQCQTIGDFEQCIAGVRDALCTAINGAKCAGGDDYMPLFCYILMKSVPRHLPSQLQTTKVISQRKFQDKYFIDCCVAMKALRNFCNVTFANDSPTTNAPAAPPPLPVQPPPQVEHVKQSLFDTLKAKLPQNNQDSTNNNDKKGFFNLSPSNSFSNFINKANVNQTNPAENQQNNNHNDNDIMVKVKTNL